MTSPERKVDPTWHKVDWFGVIAIIMFVVWISVPSSIFMRTQSMSISDTGHVVFVRSLPFGRVTAEWTIKIRVLNKPGYVCTSSGRAVYANEKDDTVMYQIGSWANKCLEQGPPMRVISTRKVVLFGLIPLRPTTQEFDILHVTNNFPVSNSVR